ncbi:hypothetical protein V8C35DRAFT_280401 [Trichoderma chlorosporum]
MIIPAGLLLLPLALANHGFWGRLAPPGLAAWLGVAREDLNYIPDDSYDYDYTDDDNLFPDRIYFPENRLESGSRCGASITCWPSKGGIYKLLSNHIVQLEFLGLDRRVPNIQRPEVTIEEEDAFCYQLRKLGARWWESEYEYRYNDRKWTGGSARDEGALYVGWPASGGVWALYTDEWDALKKGYGVIYNALTMEEQCEMIKELGGTFYEDPKDCPYLDLPEN